MKKADRTAAQTIMNKITGGKNNTPIGKFNQARLHRIQLAIRTSYFRYAEGYSTLAKDKNSIKLGITGGNVGQTTYSWKVNGKDAKKAVSYNKAFENFLIKNINGMGIPEQVRKKGMQYYTKNAKNYVEKMLKTKNYIINDNIKAYRKKVRDKKFIKNVAKEMHYYLVYEIEYTSQGDIRPTAWPNVYATCHTK